MTREDIFIFPYDSLPIQELDAKIAEAQAPIQRVEQEFEQVKKESAEKLAQAQRLSQELNISVDKYENMSKRVDRLVFPAYRSSTLT